MLRGPVVVVEMVVVGIMGAGLDVHYYLLTTMLELLVVVHVIIMLSVHHCLLLSLLTSVCTDWRSGLPLVAG